MFNKGDRVWFYWDEGAGMGVRQCCGTVVRVNPLTYRINWDNGNSQLVYKKFAESKLKLVDWDESK